LKELGLPPLPDRFPGDQDKVYGLRIFYIPTFMPVICFEALRYSFAGPSELRISISNGKGGYDWGQIVFTDRKLILDPLDFSCYEYFSLYPPISKVNYPWDTVMIDGTSTIVEVYNKGKHTIFVRSDPMRVPLSLQELDEELMDEYPEWVRGEQGNREDLADILEKFFRIWGFPKSMWNVRPHQETFIIGDPDLDNPFSPPPQ